MNTLSEEHVFKQLHAVQAAKLRLVWLLLPILWLLLLVRLLPVGIDGIIGVPALGKFQRIDAILLAAAVVGVDRHLGGVGTLRPYQIIILPDQLEPLLVFPV